MMDMPDQHLEQATEKQKQLQCILLNILALPHWEMACQAEPV